MEKEIIDMMKAAGLTEISFLYEWPRPKITRDTVQYELIDVSWEDGRVWLNVIPSYTTQAKTFVMDATWRKNTQKRVRSLVAARIEAMKNYRYETHR